MKPYEIHVGRFYHDGKVGLREVVAIEDEARCVRYRLLAAKTEREFDRHGTEMSLLGMESTVTLSAFATWAKVAYDAQEGAQMLLGLQAAKIKLSPGETTFVQGVRAERNEDPFVGGTLITYDHTEGRAVAGLEKKGLVRRVGGGEVELLTLGAALINAMVR